MTNSTLRMEPRVLRGFVPFSRTAPTRLAEVASRMVVEELPARAFLFREGDRDNQTVYLLEGEIDLFVGREQIGTLVARTGEARYPLTLDQPRRQSARARTPVAVARIDTSLLEVLLATDPMLTKGVEDREERGGGGEEWLGRLLGSSAFLNLPPDNIQELMARMESREHRAGEVIIREQAEGEHYYVIQRGRCRVSRLGPDGVPQELAELQPGQGFGEEALLSGGRRNATVTMATDGVVARIGREDFEALLCAPLLTRVDYREAAQMVRDGAGWLDVRTAEEHHAAAPEDCVHVPLGSLRELAGTLARDRRYVVCCDDARRSAAAAFLLKERGFDAVVLAGGLENAPLPAPEPAVTDGSGQHVARLQAELDLLRAERDAEIAQLRREAALCIQRLKDEVAADRANAEAARQKADQERAELAAELARTREERDAALRARAQAHEQAAALRREFERRLRWLHDQVQVASRVSVSPRSATAPSPPAPQTDAQKQPAAPVSPARLLHTVHK
jgi:CRP-like cAMP-binding protein